MREKLARRLQGRDHAAAASGSWVPGFTPSLVPSETRLNVAMMVKL